MGNFEKLSVLVIVVIIVMILVVAIYEWTGSPSEGAGVTEQARESEPAPAPPRPAPDPFPAPSPSPSPAPVVGPRGPSGLGLRNQDPIESPGPGFNWDDPRLIPDPSPTPTPAPTPTPTPSPAPAPAATEIPETTHVVVGGDTLGDISKKYYHKASLYTRILEANPGVTPESLRVGMKLKIPAMRIEAPATPSVTLPGAPGETLASADRPIPGKDYKVRRGDTWEKISKGAFNTTERWPEIYMKNMKKVARRDELHDGLVISIPK